MFMLQWSHLTRTQPCGIAMLQSMEIMLDEDKVDTDNTQSAAAELELEPIHNPSSSWWVTFVVLALAFAWLQLGMQAIIVTPSIRLQDLGNVSAVWGLPGGGIFEIIIETIISADTFVRQSESGVGDDGRGRGKNCSECCVCEGGKLEQLAWQADKRWMGRRWSFSS